MEWQGAHHRSRCRIGHEGKVRRASMVYTCVFMQMGAVLFNENTFLHAG